MLILIKRIVSTQMKILVFFLCTDKRQGRKVYPGVRVSTV